MLTLERIAELREETAHGSYAGYGVTVEEMAELLDAALAWELYAKAHGYRTESGHRCNWLYTDRGLYGTYQQGSHHTPQAAVLEALGRTVKL